jgi:hypothetical protein
MDGTGPSGVNLDFTKTQIFFLDLEWLGVGRVRMGFVHEGLEYIAHEFNHNNSLSTVYMSSPMLPITFEVENFGASAIRTDFRQICSSMLIEGSESTQYKLRTVHTSLTVRLTTASTALPLISLRLQTAYVGKGMLRPLEVGALISTAGAGVKDHLFEVIYGGTLESASFTNNSGIAAWDIAATNITGGVKLASLYLSGNQRFIPNLFGHQFWLGEGDTAGQPLIFTVVARSIGGTGEAFGSIDYEEHI